MSTSRLLVLCKFINTSVLVAILLAQVLVPSSSSSSKVTRPHTPPPPLLSMDGRPEMKLMLHIERGGGREDLCIVETVTADCYKLGLLLDLPEQLVRNEWKMSPEDSTMKCQNIISKWLEGQGRHPISWRIFIDTLKKVPLHRLAQELESLLLMEHHLTSPVLFFKCIIAAHKERQYNSSNTCRCVIFTLPSPILQHIRY